MIGWRATGHRDDVRIEKETTPFAVSIKIGLTVGRGRSEKGAALMGWLLRESKHIKGLAAAIGPSPVGLVTHDNLPREDATNLSPWDALAKKAFEGDAACYARLLSEIASWLREYYASRLPNGTVEGVVQETLIAIDRKRHTYKAPHPFDLWLTSIAAYQASRATGR
jgi:hypothetical protein